MKMNLRTRTWRAVIAAVLAALFAGSGAYTLATALEAPVAPGTVYLAAALAAGLCALGAVPKWGGALSALGVAGAAVLYAAAHLPGLRAIQTVFALWSGETVDPARLALGERTLLTCAAYLMGALFFALLNKKSLMPLAILFLGGLLIMCHAVSASTALGASVPGMIAAVAAFALTGGVQRDATACADSRRAGGGAGAAAAPRRAGNLAAAGAGGGACARHL